MQFEDVKAIVETVHTAKVLEGAYCDITCFNNSRGRWIYLSVTGNRFDILFTHGFAVTLYWYPAKGMRRFKPRTLEEFTEKLYELVYGVSK